MRAIVAILLLPAGVILAQTAEAPKRTILDLEGRSAPKLVKPTTRDADAEKPVAASDNSRGANPRALDALNAANEDLNVIRDKNVRALTTGGCAPESSARIADIAAKLQGAGVSVDELRAFRAEGGAQPGSESAILTLTSDWFKRTSDAASATASKDQKEALLDSVLPGANRSSASDADVAGLRTELDHLLAACTRVKR